MAVVTPEQVRAARALAGWSQSELAEKAGLSQTGIARVESGESHPTVDTVEKISGAFERAGVYFIADRGVEKRRNEIVTLRGREGMAQFYDDGYQYFLKNGGELLISNVDQENWEKAYGKENMANNRNRMRALSNFKMRTLIRKETTYSKDVDYAEHRNINPKFSSSVSFCIYAQEVAIIIFSENEFLIHIIKEKSLYEAYKNQFELMWEESAMII